MLHRRFTRRSFLTVAGGMAITALAPRMARAQVSANDKVNLAVIGCGGMGSRHIEALCDNPNCNIVAVCDVVQTRYNQQQRIVEEKTGKKPDVYQDFRKVLERPDIDAIFTPTPDHWHALITILACEAGKDVYVEKPVCTTIEEGRAMVNAARRYGRVVQAGTQQRSMPIFQQAIEIVHSGQLGQIISAGAWIGVNGFSEGETPAPVPEGVDWDMWLGPAPWVPFSRERYFGFMGWHDYARGGQLTNWGIHLMDIVHWGIQKDRPLSLQALGGNYRGGTGGDNYEAIEVLFEYEGCNVTWEQRPSHTYGNKGYGVRFQGEKGALYVDRNTFIVEPGSLGIKEVIGEPEKSWANPPHHNNFFDCVRTRKRPVADIEQGFRSTASVLLGGIALKAGRKLFWDGDSETFIGDEAANRHLTRVYRAPWRLA
ncbi:MAG TPA: Gfo/Idh/MocA family oxidoreductase [Candidatus Hydrogenedentes bacterium]|nr:Gfo/Idh/MocA family oxidoreductase [Candidatus Hydrogenedentota bacterium]